MNEEFGWVRLCGQRSGSCPRRNGTQYNVRSVVCFVMSMCCVFMPVSHVGICVCMRAMIDKMGPTYRYESK